MESNLDERTKLCQSKCAEARHVGITESISIKSSCRARINSPCQLYHGSLFFVFLRFFFFFKLKFCVNQSVWQQQNRNLGHHVHRVYMLMMHRKHVIHMNDTGRVWTISIFVFGASVRCRHGGQIVGRHKCITRCGAHPMYNRFSKCLKRHRNFWFRNSVVDDNATSAVQKNKIVICKFCRAWKLEFVTNCEEPEIEFWWCMKCIYARREYARYFFAKLNMCYLCKSD